MFFEDEHILIDEDGNVCGFAQLVDVTDDNIPDVAHITQLDGTGLFVSLEETEADDGIQGLFAEAEGISAFGDLDLDNEADSLGGLDLSDMQLGMLDNEDILSEIPDEELDLGENSFENAIPEISSNISFTGLTDHGLIFSSTYRSWLDGVDPDEVTADDIETIADHITQEFKQICPAIVPDNGGEGFAMIPMENGILLYDIDGAAADGEEYGAEHLIGAVGHEVGHNITRQAFEGSGIELTRIQEERCADYLSGISMGLAGISPEGVCAFLRDNNVQTEDYPAAEERIEIIQKGFDYASNAARQVLSPILFPNMDFVRNELIENVINVY